MFRTAEKVVLITLLAAAWNAHAVVLPYSERTANFTGVGTYVTGDIDTVGMAGALVGLADNFDASFDNPAGLAMTMRGEGLNFTQNRVYDASIQDKNNEIVSSHFLAGIKPYPWGFGLGFRTPHAEGMTYDLASGRQAKVESWARDFRISAARLYMKNKLSLGISLNIGLSVQNLEFPAESTLNSQHTSLGIGGSVGGLYQFDGRYFLGIALTTGMVHPADTANNASPDITNFYRPMHSPFRVQVGGGWIPNQYFKAGIGLYAIGTEENSALVSDQTKTIGQGWTFHPRMGLTYQFVDFKELRGLISAGGYWEASRISGESGRFHVTTALKLDPWVFFFGWGIDLSANYENYIYSAGIDIVKIMRKLDLIPPDKDPRLYAGFLPDPLRPSDVGLPRALVKRYRKPKAKGGDVIEVGKQLPGRVKSKYNKTTKNLKKIGGNLIDSFTGDLEKKPKKKRRSKKSKKKKTKKSKR